MFSVFSVSLYISLFLFSFVLFFFEAVLTLNPEFTNLTETSWGVSSKDPPVSTGVADVHCPCLAIYVVLGIQTQVRMLVQQAPHPLSHLSIHSHWVFKNILCPW